jgi:uncharacterized protein YaaQ
MKLIIAIVQLDDVGPVLTALSEDRISATLVEARGGLLRDGFAAILIGLDNDHVQHALTILDRHCQTRRTILPDQFTTTLREWPLAEMSTVEVGGATAFILPVSRFHRF